MPRPVPFVRPAQRVRSLVDVIQELLLRDPAWARQLRAMLEWRLNELNRQQILRQPDEAS